MKPKNKPGPKGNREFFAGTTEPSTLNDSDRTVDIVWYSGVPVVRQTWSGQYIRKFDPAGADLSYLNNGAPVLDNHDCYTGASGQMGVVQKAWADNGLYKGTLRFSKRTEVDGIWQDVKDGILQKFSMGVEILAEHEIKAEGQADVKMADKWRPFEISLAPLPADFGTTTLAKAKDDEEEDPDEEEPDDDPDDEDEPKPEKSKKKKMRASFRDREADILRLR